ncbi:hypothetical protein P3T20_000452 [Paraburkholderia sp. GAS206C]|uniref:hypothetical protein n=1 Tax=unclassified Paraburkholderia TaxID=2615204 RepID=UPI003D1E1E9D
MREQSAAGFAVTLAFERVLGTLDAVSTAIAGFALLAGARAFTFTALLAWREPVLGGAGLVLLGLVGWLRWFSGQRRVAAARGRRLHDKMTDRLPTARDWLLWTSVRVDQPASSPPGAGVPDRAAKRS